MTHRLQRPTEPICPPWCAGHDELFQPWELDGPNRSRDHSHRVAHISGDGYAAGVELTTTENVKHELSAARVFVLVEDLRAPADLTPYDARELARLLLDGADQAEARQ